MISEDDLDDTPLFTRQSSQKLNKWDSSKSALNMARTRKTRDERSDSINSLDLCKDKNRLSFFRASMFATILEDVLTQLRILAECNNEMRVYKTIKEMGELRLTKFGIQRSENGDEIAEVDYKDLESEHHKLNKLASDRKFCEDVLTNTYLELAMKHSYNPLVTAKKAVYDRIEHYAFLIEDEARNTATKRELKKQLRLQRNRARSNIYDTNVAVEKLRNEVEDAALNKEVRARYIVKWEVARSEQHDARIESKESGPTDNIAFYRRQLEAEQRVHYEAELHTNILIDEIIKQLDVWMDRYDDDTSDIDLKIQIKKSDGIVQQNKREEMEAMLALHDEEIKNWKQFKVDREKALQYQKMMTHSAHVVQAWWRGLLVRQKLGPYKPKRRAATKPKTEKKKKK